MDGLLPAVAAAIERAKGNDRLAPVWVWAPGKVAAQSLVRRLARTVGILNTSVMTLEHIVQAIVGPSTSVRRLSSDASRELTRQVAALAQAPLAGHDSAMLVDALAKAFADLRARSDVEVDAIAESSALAREVVRLHGEFRLLVAGRRPFENMCDQRDLLEMAVRMDADHPPVVAVVTEPPGWQEAELLYSLRDRDRLQIVSVMTGETPLDDTLRLALWGFAHDEVLVDTEPTPADRVIVAPDPATEIDLAINACLDAAEQGVAFADMSLLFPSSSPHASIAVERLRAAGIPWRGRESGTLAQSNLGQFLLQLMHVLDRNFAVDAVEQWLVGSSVRDPADGSRVVGGSWLDLARRARVSSGIDDWVERIPAFEAASTRADESQMRADAVDCATFFTSLRELLLERPSTWSGWAKLSQQCIDLYVGSAQERSEWPRRSAEVAVLVEGRLAQLQHLDRVSGGTITTGMYLDGLRSTLQAPLPASKDPLGVFVGRVDEAVATHVELLIICGLNEGLLPAAEASSGLAIALRAPGEESFSARQRRMFLHALAAGSRRVYVCGRADQRAQRERRPSLWLLEIAATLAGRPVAAADLIERDFDWLTNVPSFTALLRTGSSSPSESLAALTSLDEWVQHGDDPMLHRLVAAQPALRRSFAAVAARDGAQLTRFDGLVGPQPWVRAQMAKPLKPTDFEHWAECPMRYFFRSVLAVSQREDDDASIELSPRDKGILVHEVLERFLKTVPSRTAPAQVWTTDERVLLHSIADSCLQEAQRTGAALPGLLHDMERRKLHDDLDMVVEDDEAMRREFGVLPGVAESSFGLGAVPALEVPRANSVPVRFLGRIDRVDRSADGGRAMVIDYKTGRAAKFIGTKTDPVVAGTKVQNALYAAATQAANPGADVHAYYWFVADESAKERLIGYAFDDKVKERLGEVVDDMATGIESGLFAAVPGAEDRDSFKHCRHCQFDSVCVADRDEAWNRKSADPVALSYLRLSDIEKEKTIDV